MQSLVILSHYDASPVLVKFGLFADLVTPCARFLHYDVELKKWVALPVEQFRQVSKRPVPRKGLVQLLAQRMEASFWGTGGFAPGGRFSIPSNFLVYRRGGVGARHPQRFSPARSPATPSPPTCR